MTVIIIFFNCRAPVGPTLRVADEKGGSVRIFRI